MLINLYNASPFLLSDGINLKPKNSTGKKISPLMTPLIINDNSKEKEISSNIKTSQRKLPKLKSRKRLKNF